MLVMPVLGESIGLSPDPPWLERGGCGRCGDGGCGAGPIAWPLAVAAVRPGGPAVAAVPAVVWM